MTVYSSHSKGDKRQVQGKIVQHIFLLSAIYIFFTIGTALTLKQISTPREEHTNMFIL